MSLRALSATGRYAVVVRGGLVGVAIAVMNDFLQLLGNQQNPFSGKKHA